MPELFDVLDGDGVVAEEIEEGILEHGAMASGEDEAIAVDKVWVLWVEVHKLLEENVGGGGHAHGHTGMARLCLFDCVDGQETDRVDAVIDELIACLLEGSLGLGCNHGGDAYTGGGESGGKVRGARGEGGCAEARSRGGNESGGYEGHV